MHKSKGSIMFFSKKFSIAVAAVVLSVGMSASSRADFIGTGVQLSTLLDGGTLQIGDKLFSNFTYSHTGDMPDATGVNVITGTDSLGNFGLRFQGGFHDNAGGNSSDALIGYKVTVTDPSFVITDAHLTSNQSVQGPLASLTISENFAGTTNQLFTGTFNNADGNPVGTPKFTDVTFFDVGHSSLTVTKDILAQAGSDGIATLSQVDQTFSQNHIPEPSSVVLLACGSVILGLVARRRKFAVKA
jgi:hypothetical protein